MSEPSTIRENYIPSERARNERLVHMGQGRSQNPEWGGNPYEQRELYQKIESLGFGGELTIPESELRTMPREKREELWGLRIDKGGSSARPYFMEWGFGGGFGNRKNQRYYGTITELTRALENLGIDVKKLRKSTAPELFNGM